MKLSTEERTREAAFLYDNGRYKESFNIYLETAEQGNVKSQRFIGWLYFRGEGTQIDKERAIYWFNKAAQSGDEEAMFGVARVYMSDSNYSEALSWYKESASKQYLPSMYWVAKFLYQGISIQKDEEDALKLFHQAANLGHLKSLREYSVILIKGKNGLLGRPKGIFLFFKFVVLVLVQSVRDPMDQKAIF